LSLRVWSCHCEESLWGTTKQSRCGAIQWDCFASLAMTNRCSRFGVSRARNDKSLFTFWRIAGSQWRRAPHVLSILITKKGRFLALFYRFVTYPKQPFSHYSEHRIEWHQHDGPSRYRHDSYIWHSYDPVR